MAMLWLALVLLLVIAVVWAVVLLVSWPLWIAIVVTAVCVLAFVTVLVVRRVRAALRATALERELLRQASQQADGARPDRRAEVLKLQAQMKESIAGLKKTRLGKQGGNAALYTLPWYVIVGPPAAGKTTALTQSGLGFIAPPGSSSAKLRGTAGTKNCDWWFSQHAILLDTAGRLATGEDDRDEWLGFLDTLRRFRPGRPLEGVIVAVSVEDLLSASELELEELAKTLRARADEVMNRLEMVLPLYVMVTKVDLVAGFNEFWGDLGKSQRAQSWGASFPYHEEFEEPARAVEHEFEGLQSVLYARMLQRLANEPLAEARARILQFPLEFAAVKRPLASFIDELCRPNPYQETPLLRGFYFSSGTQTGRQLDRVLQNMSRGFNLPLAPQAAARQGTPQSYFVTELFQKVIFPDRHLGMRSSSRLQRLARMRMLQVAVLAVLVMLLVIPAVSSYAENLDLVSGTSRDVDESLKLERAPGAGAAATAGALDMLVGRVQSLEKAKDSASLWGYFGPYAAEELHGALKGVYLTRLRALVSGPVQEQLSGDVRSAGDLVQMDSENFQTSYDDLKLYLMLCKPEHLSTEWATPRLAKAWARALRSETKTDEAKLQTHASYYLAALAADKSWAWTGDEAAISRAQGRLMAVPLDELRFGWLVEAAKGAPPIRPEKIFFGPAAQYWNARKNVEVPGLYTALGWQKVRTLLEAPDSRLDLEPWVLGQTALSDGGDARAMGAERLRDLYFQRYIKAWSDFIAGLDVVAPAEMKGAVDELRVLSTADGPYVRLFKVLAENARLEVAPPKSLADKALDKGLAAADKALDKVVDGGVDAGPPPRVVSAVEQHFEPLLKFGFGDASSGKADAAPSGLSQYLAQLTTLEVALSQLSESKEDPAKEFDAELSRTATSVQRLLGGLDSSTRLVLEPLLMNPIRGSRAGVMRADFGSLSDDWKAQVWEIYSTKLATRYPFADVPAEVSIAEFTEFFKPDGGLIWKFFKDHLEGRLERSGTHFVPKAAADTLPFRADFLQCLNIASEITDAVFGGGPLPSVPFAIKILPASSNISEIAFVMDGAQTVYRNEPERWISITWPGKDNPRGAAIQVRGAGFTDEIPRLGDFGLFRLFELGALKPTGGLSAGTQIMVGSWPLARPGEPPVSIEVRPAKTVHPFTRGFFRRLKCPAALVQGGAAAPAPGRP